jgi:peptidoglycan/xylan/chitin deacetylase (PgdA/CDA1 family)
VEILQAITGTKVLGYRAPSWSIIKRNYHYLEALESIGLHYDASIFPVKTFLYGIPDAPVAIHRPVVGGRELALYEVPMSVAKVCGKNIGFSGGFYFRLFPRWLIEKAIRATNKKGRSALVYLHPREIDASERRLKLPPLASFIQYHNVGGTRVKLERIMRAFSFVSIAEVLQAIEIERVR